MKNPSLKEDKRTCGVDFPMFWKIYFKTKISFVWMYTALSEEFFIQNHVAINNWQTVFYGSGRRGKDFLSVIWSERYINYTRTGIIESCNYWSFSLPERLKIYLWCKTWSGVKFSNHVFYLHAILYLAKNITSKKSLESYPGMLHRQSRTDVLWVVLNNGRSKQKKTTLLVEQ